MMVNSLLASVDMLVRVDGEIMYFIMQLEMAGKIILYSKNVAST